MDSRELSEVRQMNRRVLVTGLTIALMVTVGCTSVQKGCATGGLIGGAAGAGVGHYLTTAGGGPGALVGLGVGAATGAVAAEHYYGSENSEEIATAQETIDQLSGELQASETELAHMASALEKEKAQQKALLEAYEKARQDRKTLSANMPDNIQVVSDGETVTFTILSEVLFGSGRAELTKEGKGTLNQAARAIRTNFPDALIEVRGHTDSVPIRYSGYKSNWELSCARSLSVLHCLVEAGGFKTSSFTVVGCADTRPVASNDTADGRKKNRRAEIVVRPPGARVADVSELR